MTDFVAMLMEMQGGECAIVASQKLREVVEAIRQTRGKGKLSLSFSLKPAKVSASGEVLQLDVEMDTTVKKPELKTGTALFFVSEEGALTRTDPRQEEMFEERKVKKNA